MKVESFAVRLKEALERCDMKPSNLGLICSVNKSTISQYLSGKYEAKHDRVIQFAQVLGVDAMWLEGHDVPMCPVSPDFAEGEPDMRCMLPVLGTVAAGAGVIAEENIQAYEYADRCYCDSEHFYLIVEGDSMQPDLYEGDRVLCERRETLEDGDLGVFVIDDEKGLVKKYRADKEKISLISSNPYWPVLDFRGKDRLRVRIVGKVVQSVRSW